MFLSKKYFIFSALLTKQAGLRRQKLFPPILTKDFLIRCKPRNGCKTAWLGVHPPVQPVICTKVHCSREGFVFQLYPFFLDVYLSEAYSQFTFQPPFKTHTTTVQSSQINSSLYQLLSLQKKKWGKKIATIVHSLWELTLGGFFFLFFFFFVQILLALFPIFVWARERERERERGNFIFKFLVCKMALGVHILFIKFQKKRIKKNSKKKILLRYLHSKGNVGGQKNQKKKNYSVRCTVYGVRCTVYGVRCTVYGVRCTGKLSTKVVVLK